MSHAAPPASSVTADQAAPAPLSPPVSGRKRSTVHVSRIVIDSLLVLPIGCLVALLWANILPESYFRFAQPLAFAVNDIGIVFFFAIITKEVVEATLPGGALHPWQRAALPAAAAVGGILVPMAIYVVVLRIMSEPMLLQAGWALPCAIDIAMCYLVAGLIFGRHPAIPFLLLLAIASDAIGVALLAVFRAAGDMHLGLGVGLMAAAIGTALLLRRSGVRNFWAYLAVPGALSWSALYLGGLHPALALVPIIPFMPHAKHDAGLFVEPAAQAHDTLSRFEHWWRPPVQVVLFLFGLINAGVPLHGSEPGMWALPVAMLVGRPIGVLAGAQMAVAAGLHRTLRVGWRELLVLGCAASIGLTVGLFFAAAAMPTGPLLIQMKLGALYTIGGAALAWAVAAGLGVGRFGRRAAAGTKDGV